MKIILSIKEAKLLKETIEKADKENRSSRMEGTAAEEKV